MRCPLVKSITFASAALFSGFYGGSATALDEERLWLPTKYNTLFLELKDAALAAESLERCVTVLRGTIDIDQSRNGKPIFRILCRQSNGLSYNEMVDGVSMETLTTTAPVPLTPEEERARQEALWLECKEEFDKKTRLMANKTFEQEPLAPITDILSEKAVLFTFDFTAEDMYGANLYYTARCTFDEAGILKFKISARKPKES